MELEVEVEVATPPEDSRVVAVRWNGEMQRLRKPVKITELRKLVEAVELLRKHGLLKDAGEVEKELSRKAFRAKHWFELLRGEITPPVLKEIIRAELRRNPESASVEGILREAEIPVKGTFLEAAREVLSEEGYREDTEGRITKPEVRVFPPLPKLTGEEVKTLVRVAVMRGAKTRSDVLRFYRGRMREKLIRAMDELGIPRVIGTNRINLLKEEIPVNGEGILEHQMKVLRAKGELLRAVKPVLKRLKEKGVNFSVNYSNTDPLAKPPVVFVEIKSSDPSEDLLKVEKEIGFLEPVMLGFKTTEWIPVKPKFGFMAVKKVGVRYVRFLFAAEVVPEGVEVEEKAYRVCSLKKVYRVKAKA